MDSLISPHGGKLSHLIISAQEGRRLKEESIDFPSIELTDHQLCDLDLLLNGALSPLTGFLGRADYDSVVSKMRLADNLLWPIPVVLGVSPKTAEEVAKATIVALRDSEGMMLAGLKVGDIWEPDFRLEAEAVYGKFDTTHPMVREFQKMSDTVYMGGEVLGIQPVEHYDFRHLRHTPAELRNQFQKLGWRKIVGFQTRSPLHRAHKEMTTLAATKARAHLLLHPVVGTTKLGDIDHYTRVRCYQAISETYPPELMKLSLLNLAMRMSGPREAIWHSIIQKNHGCTHFIVGLDHAGPGVDSNGEPFYGLYDAQDLLEKHEPELGVTMVPFQEMVYVEDRAQYLPVNDVKENEKTKAISETELRRRIREGLEIPAWFSYPSVIEELRRSYPPKHGQGITLFFTGLSGAGKSTIAKILLAKFLEIGGRPVTLLDGDIVRKNLSSELGFSREHRDLNILRIGFVANEISKNGGVAICAPIAPYESTRKQLRELISPRGPFIEIHVSTPIEVCEQRDRKGLYAKARQGLIENFTGVSDPYEAPVEPELRIDTTNLNPEEAAQVVLLYLEREGFQA